MFNGAYIILNVEHDIIPNHMTTKFEGVRLSKDSIPILKSDNVSDVYSNLIPELSQIKTYDDLITKRSAIGQKVNTELESNRSIILPDLLNNKEYLLNLTVDFKTKTNN
jgi:hypothetical protein